jgi:hypothetical protein
MKLNIIERVMATQKTVDAFKGATFADGTADCVQLVLAHARHMGKRIKIPRYGSRKSAAAAMRELGFATLSDAMDHHFRRIEKAQIMAGDIVEMPGGNGFSALTIAVGNGRVLGFHEDIPHCDVLQPLMISGAWRID